MVEENKPLKRNTKKFKPAHVPNTGYPTLSNSTMLRNRIPICTNCDQVSDKHYATPKNKIVRTNKYGTCTMLQGFLTPFHLNIVDLLLAFPEKYGTHITTYKNQEYRACVFTPATLLKDLNCENRSKEWLLEKLQQMKMATFKLQPNKQFLAGASEDEWDSLLISVFNEVRSYTKDQKSYLIEVHFQLSFLDLWRYDMHLNYSPLLASILTVDQPWLQKVIKYIVSQEELNHSRHHILFDCGLYCVWSIKWLKYHGKLPKNFEPNEADLVSNRYYFECAKTLVTKEMRRKLDYLFGKHPEGQSGTFSDGKGIHISDYKKTHEDHLIYYKRAEDSVDENGKNLVQYGRKKTRIKQISTFNDKFEALKKQNPDVKPLRLLNHSSINDDYKALSLDLKEKLFQKMVDDEVALLEDVLKHRRLTYEEDAYLDDLNFEIEQLSFKQKEIRRLNSVQKRTPKAQDYGHYRD